jgi:hypothetical protein
VLRPGVLLAVATAAALAATAQRATGSPAMRIGIFDQVQATRGPPQAAFGTFKKLGARVVRVNLNWGGKFGVARSRPRQATNPADPAYRWTMYDRAVRSAAENGIQVLFAIYGTPPWANRGRPRNVPPRFAIDLRSFAYAAATRYSGSFAGADGEVLPAVRDWLAWIEPNNPAFLQPQYQRIAGRWVVESAVTYAAICNAVYGGVHATLVAGERVACGGTAPDGNDDPESARPSVSPLTFLRAAKDAGLQRFDAWAHNPYDVGEPEAPGAKPVVVRGEPKTSVTLGNISDLTALLTKLYGWKPLWITAYGYQTNPPDRVTGVSPATQATYLTEAFAIARADPRIQLMLWFLLRDDARPIGWQSGLITAGGKKKPSFAAFRALARAAPTR